MDLNFEFEDLNFDFENADNATGFAYVRFKILQTLIIRIAGEDLEFFEVFQEISHGLGAGLELRHGRRIAANDLVNQANF